MATKTKPSRLLELRQRCVSSSVAMTRPSREASTRYRSFLWKLRVLKDKSCADEFAATEGATPQQPRGESVAACLLVGTRDDEVVPACDETSRSRLRRSSARASRVSSLVGHFHARLRSKGRALVLALRPPLSSLNSQLACKFCLILVDRYLRRGWVDRTVCDSWISFWDIFVWLLSLKFRFEIRGGARLEPRGWFSSAFFSQRRARIVRRAVERPQRPPDAFARPPNPRDDRLSRRCAFSSTRDRLHG